MSIMRKKKSHMHAMYCDSYFCNFMTCFFQNLVKKNLFASTVSCITSIGAFFLSVKFSVKLNLKCSFEVTSFISKILLLKILFRDTKFVPSHILQKEKMVIRSLQRLKFW